MAAPTSPTQQPASSAVKPYKGMNVWLVLDRDWG